MTVSSARTARRAPAVLLLATVFTACESNTPGSQPEAQPGAAQSVANVADTSAPTLAELENASFTGVEEAGGPFTFANGKWEGRPYEPGGASAPRVTLVGNFRLAGDLDGDSRDEAVVLLAGATGGTGETSYVAVVRRTGTQLDNIATARVGDRVQLRDGRLDGRRIVLDVVQGGEKDAGCCPGDLVTRRWELQADGLEEGAPSVTGRLGIDAIGAAEWELRSWKWDEPAPPAPRVTLKLDGQRLVGSAGCNSYVAPAKAGEMPGDLAVGPVGTTRKMCPEADMAVEQRFARQLAAVKKLSFTGGQLALTYGLEDGSFGAMLFDRR